MKTIRSDSIENFDSLRSKLNAEELNALYTLVNLKFTRLERADTLDENLLKEIGLKESLAMNVLAHSAASAYVQNILHHKDEYDAMQLYYNEVCNNDTVSAVET